MHRNSRFIVKKHPEADSLYVEQIDVGEEEPRTVCSGLVKYMSEDQIRGATVIVVVSSSSAPSEGLSPSVSKIDWEKSA